MFRGNAIAGLRGVPLPEERVWLLTSVLFALIHVPNFVLGAPPVAAVGNAVIAFFGGTLLYVVRRASGSILFAMLTHGLWDFTLFSAQEDTYGSIRTPLSLVLVIAIIATRRSLFDPSDDRAPTP
ncbi:MAG: CPBP family intramembrane glutamic endopeptidase [Actinomycetota bacterium]